MKTDIQPGPEEFEFVVVADREDVPDGEKIFIEIDDLEIVVFNIAGKLFAVGDVCSHDNGPIGDGEIDGYNVICPRHGARFDVRTGKACTLPAVIDIPSYPVRIENDQILIGIPV